MRNPFRRKRKYPLNTSKNFFRYVKDNPNLTDRQIAVEAFVLSYAEKKDLYNVMDLVRTVRDEIACGVKEL